jgi:hypothetical protein
LSTHGKGRVEGVSERLRERTGRCARARIRGRGGRWGGGAGVEPFFARRESGHCTAGSTLPPGPLQPWPRTLPPGPLQPWPRPLASTPTPTECRTSISAHTHANTPATAAVATGGAPTLHSLFRRSCGQTWLPPHSCSRTSISAHTQQTRQQRQRLQREERQPCRCFSGDHVGRPGFRRTPIAGPASVLTHTQTHQQRQRLQRRSANLAGAFPAIMRTDLAPVALL